MSDIDQKRSILVQSLFPNGSPRLWCPLLTHYRADGSLDRERISAHIAHMRPYVSCYLAPGSTGDGWEMSAEESLQLIDLLLQEAAAQDFWLMVGVLHTARGAAVRALQEHLSRFGPATELLLERRICGFTVTPPQGADLPQELIHQELEAMAQTGAPLALYQLPQITQNEMSPATFQDLVARYPNIYVFKDTSGEDRIATAGVDTGGVLMLRGAEGEYASWLQRKDGYYGFLLSTANCFARELSAVVQAGVAGDTDTANAVSARVSAVVSEVFQAAGTLSFGNPFANANKAIDHHFAHGPAAAEGAEAPMTHSGARLPVTLLETAAAALRRHNLYPEAGYLE